MSGLIALGAAVAVITWKLEQDLELVWLLPKQ